MIQINDTWVKQHVHARKNEGHKKTFGHVLVVAGSEGTAGASILSATAALKTGCGMVTALIPNVAVQVLMQQSPEIMYLTNPNLQGVVLEKFDAILIGPGLGFSTQSKFNLNYILANYKGPIVLDADALTLLAENKTPLKPNYILTPHPGEFARLQGFEYDSNNKEEQANNFINNTLCVLVLKGAGTLVGQTGKALLQNTTGNNGMATAGSGDVLAGIIVSICAQGYDIYIAAALGVYIHGLAANNAVLEVSKSGLVASGIIHELAKIRVLD